MYLNIFANEINLHYNNALTFKLLDSYLTESFVNSILLLPEFYLLAYIFVFFLLFFFNFYSSQNNEQLIDCDFLNASLLVESEKEISSLDDFIFLVVLGLYFFGWYFFVHAFVYFNQVPEMFLLIMIIPIFLIFIFLTPAMLAYDFGIYFLCFFRGVGASSILLVEMMFDYIAFLSFYIRLIVQGIRLLLILLVYISFHDFILFVDVNDNVLIGNENLWDQFCRLRFNLSSLSYFILLAIPKFVIHFMYELLHLFFVVSVQIIAFVAMVFWLFMFLYSFFFMERMENHFRARRELKKKLFNNNN